MAQNAPASPPLPRPLPRGAQSAKTRPATRPRFQWPDAAWMALAMALYLGIGAALHVARPSGAVTIALAYLLGWRLSGRTCGIVTALLLATTGSYASNPSAGWRDDAFAALSLAALFAYAAGWSGVSGTIAAAAGLLNPAGILLGLIVVGFSFAQRRSQALLTLLLVLVIVIGGEFGLHFVLHQQVAMPIFGGASHSFSALSNVGTAFLGWFLLPYLTEIADPIRRARWLPLLVWAIVLTAALAAVHLPGATAAEDLSLLSLAAVLVAAGIARLLPLMTADLPNPGTRYLVAVLAVLSLVAISIHRSWPVQPAALPAPTAALSQDAPASSPTTPTYVAAPANTLTHSASFSKAPTIVHKATPPKPIQPKPHLTATKPRQPAVRLYTVVNGHTVRRSKWAIQWDLHHPH